MLIDMRLLKQILYVTCNVLKENFFYDNDSLTRFLNQLEQRTMDGYIHLEETIDEILRAELKYDPIKRTYFTAYFVSEQLSACLYFDCHFTENELILFDNILPKYTGEKPNGIKSSQQRTDFRKLFKEL